ncbi:MAG: GDP-mannose 4,6-dehydratase [Candidatus Aenigmarchaeota archaeon]|nr:GDP-mannose 4,6-dehydratase [Candidatus Aenigmarchaeota archaeon]
MNWKGTNVLVTGATGFLGSWLTERLAGEGANVSVLVENECTRKVCIKHLLGKLDVVTGDVRDPETVRKMMGDKDVIFHLAAVTQVIYAIRNPVETFDVNLKGTLNILECLRKNDHPFLVYMSTDKVYGEPSRLPIEADDPLSAKSPYDASKLAADRACYSYHKTYGTKLSIVRSSNIYGGREANELRAVPDFVRSLIRSQPPVIRGSGRHERDFVYVGDVVNGLVSVAENSGKTNGEAFVFGTGRPVSVYDLAKIAIKASGLKLEPEVLGKPTPGEIDRQYISYKKAREFFGWQPKVRLEDGLALTLKWYRQNPWIEDVIKATSERYKIQSLA